MKKFITIIAVAIIATSAFAETKVKVHCEAGNITTYIYGLNEYTDTSYEDAMQEEFGNYLEVGINHVSFNDGIEIFIDKDFKQGTWVSEAIEIVKDNPDIWVSASFADADIIILPYKGHIIVFYAWDN